MRGAAGLVLTMVVASGMAGCLSGEGQDDDRSAGLDGGNGKEGNGDEAVATPSSRTLTFAAEPRTGSVPANVTFTASVVLEAGGNGSADPGNLTYILAYGDGQVERGDHRDFPLERVHTYRVPRAYAATLTVTFEDGEEVTRDVELSFELPDRPPIGHTTVFALIPEPGYPEGIAVDSGTVYVTGPSALPGVLLGVGEQSRIWRFDAATGEPAEPIPLTIETEPRGLGNLAVDAAGRLYVASFEPGLGVLRIDPATGSQEVYAPIPDIPACGPVAPAPPGCSPTALDRAPGPNDLTFDDAGNLYVTDTFQATIWRVAPGGAEVVAWFQHEALDQNFGPNGIRLGPDGATVYFAISSSDTQPLHPAGIYTLPLVEAPQGGDLALFHEILMADGIAFGESGLLYVVAILDNQVVAIRPNGTEAFRFPTAGENEELEVPYDHPATLAFHDERRSVLVTNHAVFDGAARPEHFAVLEAFVDDLGLPLVGPQIP